MVRFSTGVDNWGRRRRPCPRTVDYEGKIAELVERSQGKVRADKVHERLEAMGYEGSPRTTRRAVARVKAAYEAGHRRVLAPWVTEPGLWMQWDYGEGPEIDGRPTSLFCAWLAWSRYRVVLPLADRTLPSVVMALDRALRAFGGAPTYALTDNEKTVTTDHVCGIAVRNPQIVAASRHYGLSVATCVPADPESKGGSEATVRVAKADIVPTEHNLRPGYGSFAELEEACESFCEQVNGRKHRVTGRVPAEMLREERGRLHPLPDSPHTLCFGETRKVSKESTISVGRAIYSVPHELVGERVWARVHDGCLVVVHAGGERGPREVARTFSPQIDPLSQPGLGLRERTSRAPPTGSAGTSRDSNRPHTGYSHLSSTGRRHSRALDE